MKTVTAARHCAEEELDVATTKSTGNIYCESDGAYITITQDCEFGLTGESMWTSASTARALITYGKAELSDPAPKQ